jgi:hypothetical protein
MTKYDPSIIRDTFHFLVDEFGFRIVEDEEHFNETRAYAFVMEYVSAHRRVILNYDYKENFFYFYLIRGRDTRFPNDLDQENIHSFWGVFRHFEPQLELKKLQPAEDSFLAAATLNAELLKRYCARILRGEEWI